MMGVGVVRLEFDRSFVFAGGSGQIDFAKEEYFAEFFLDSFKKVQFKCIFLAVAVMLEHKWMLDLLCYIQQVFSLHYGKGYHEN